MDIFLLQSLSIHATIYNSLGIMRMLGTGILQTQKKTAYGKLFKGNGQGTDI